MHGDRFLPLTSGPTPAQLVERHQWVAFLGSVGLHVLVLLSLPWLMEREPLPPPLEIEVRLEQEAPLPAQIQRQASHTRHSRVSRSLTASRPPALRRPPVTPPIALQDMQVELKEVRKRKIRSAGNTIKLASSAMTAPAPVKQAGTAPETPGNQGQGAAPGPTLQANAPASLPPRPAFAGRQPSIAQASPPQPGEDSSPGPRFLSGSTPGVQSLAPEYRHASRPGGALASQGGAQQPAAGLEARANEARQGGWQTASASQSVAATASPIGRATGRSALSRGEAPAAGRTADGGSNRPGKEPGMALAASPVGGGGATARAAASAGWTGSSRDSGSGASGRGGSGKEPGISFAASPIGGGSGATKMAASGGGTGNIRDNGSGSGGKGGAAATPGELASGGLTGSSGPGASASTAASGSARSGPDGSGGTMGGSRFGGSEGGSGGFQLAAADGGRSPRGGPGSQHGQLADGDAPINASFESVESSKPTMQLATANTGSARLLEDRYTATSVKASTPTHFCQIPLMMAGLGGPIPKGLDNIMPSPSAMDGELPPQHLPGNQMPVYPLGALGGNLHGKVTLRAEVLTSGVVGKVLLKQSSGAQILDAAAQDTVRRWRFQPAQRNGQPIVAWMTVPIEYRNPQTLNGANP